MVSQTPTIYNSSSSNSKKHVFSWSGGKDSTASILLFHEHESELLNPGDEVIILFAEVMYDKKKGISGHNPDIIEFIYEKKKIFESWGYKVEILRAEKDFLDIFYHKLTRSPDPLRIGLTNGFPIASCCSIKRDCKIKPMEEWKKANLSENDINYVGIAIDEPKRLESLKKHHNTESILEKYGYTEIDAKRLCARYDMLSPQYLLNGGKQQRDGCWFCSNCKLVESKVIKERMPKVWKEYIELENIPNLAYPKWNPYSKETLHDRDEYLSYGFKQMTIFDYM